MKIKSFISILTGAAVMAASGATVVSAADYGVPGSPVIGPSGLAYVTLVDENGTPVENPDITISMSSVESPKMRYAMWKGNSDKEFESYDAEIPDEGMFYLSRSDFSSLETSGKELQNLILKSELDSTSIGNYMSVLYPSGEAIKALFQYEDDEPAEIFFEQPAGDFTVYADAGWSSRNVNWFFNLLGTEADDFNFNDYPGVCKSVTLPQGEYEYRLGYDNVNTGGSAGNKYDRLVIDDKTRRYVKKTFRLCDVYPGNFDENGKTHIKVIELEVGTVGEYYYDYVSDTQDQSACIAFLSGNLVSAPIPDEEGYVTILVEEETKEFYLYSHMFSGGRSGGGRAGLKSKIYLTDEYDCTTAPLSDTGITMYHIDPGEYMFSAEGLPEGYKISYDNLVIKEEPEGIPDCTIKLERKEYSVSAGKCDNGMLAFSSEKVLYKDTTSFLAVPDKGYRFGKAIVKDSIGNEIPVSEDNTFVMPASDVTVDVIFEKIIYGDIDGDGAVTVHDAILLKKYILCSTDSISMPEEADINQDGIINVFDYMHLVGMILSGQ